MRRLIRPTIRYRASFLQALKEFADEGKPNQIHRRDDESNLFGNFRRYIQKVRARERGLYLPENYVPESIYWLVDEHGFIGQSSLRHKLSRRLRQIGGHIGYAIRPSRREAGHGRKILALTLKKARQKNLKKVLLTCDENNIASKKIIESNGGIFKNSIRLKKEKSKRLQYWIHLE